MWSTITSPTNSTKKLIVVQKNAKLIEPQLISVDCNNIDHSNVRPKNHVNGGGGGRGDLDLVRRFRSAAREVSIQENHRSHHVTRTVSRDGSGPAKVTSQGSIDNKTPVTSA